MDSDLITFIIISSTSSSPQSLLLQIGEAMLEEEAQEAAKEKTRYMEEHCPDVSVSGSVQELQVSLPLS